MKEYEFSTDLSNVGASQKISDFWKKGIKHSSANYFIYKITNLKTNKFYIGVTVNVRTRVLQHISEPSSSLRAKNRLGSPKHWSVMVIHSFSISDDVKRREKILEEKHRVERYFIHKYYNEFPQLIVNRVSEKWRRR